MLDRLTSAGIAITLAFLVWLHARNREQEILDNVPIPVTIQLPGHELGRYELELNGPSQILASFTGPASRVREVRGMIQRGEMNVNMTCVVPAERANDARYLDTVNIRAEDLEVPFGVHVNVLAGHNRIPVTVRRLIERPLPVVLDHAIEDRLNTVQIEPTTVVVRGPQEILERLNSVSTKPFTLPKNTPTDTLDEVVVRSHIALVDELEGRAIKTTPATVSVRVTLRPKRKSYEVRVPVHFLCPVNCPWQPQWVQSQPLDADSNPRADLVGYATVKVIGPNQDEPPPLHAFIDLTGREFQVLGDVRPRMYTEEPIQLQLPKEFQVVHCPPRSEAFELHPRFARAERPEFLPPALTAPLAGLRMEVGDGNEGRDLLAPFMAGVRRITPRPLSREELSP